MHSHRNGPNLIRKRDRGSKDRNSEMRSLANWRWLSPANSIALPIYCLTLSFNGSHITSLLTTLYLFSDWDGPGNCGEIEQSNWRRTEGKKYTPIFFILTLQVTPPNTRESQCDRKQHGSWRSKVSWIFMGHSKGEVNLTHTQVLLLGQADSGKLTKEKPPKKNNSSLVFRQVDSTEAISTILCFENAGCWTSFMDSYCVFQCHQGHSNDLLRLWIRKFLWRTHLVGHLLVQHPKGCLVVEN